MNLKRIVSIIVIIATLAILFNCKSETGSLINTHKKINGGEISILYKDNVQIDSFYIKDNLIKGLRMSVDTIDSVKIYTNYIDGKKNGIQKGYYLDNTRSYEVLFKNDTIIGEGFYYHSNGTIKVYEYRNDKDGDIIFQRFYDNKGNLTKSTGRGLIQLSRSSDTIKVNEEYVGKIIVANPPFSKTIIMISDFTSDSIGKNHKILDGVYRHCFYKEIFKKPGHYKKIVSWAIEDSLSAQIQKGQKVLDIFVLKNN